jgi:CBS domain containing-hemolysin-like protein
LEELVGPIEDEFDRESPLIRQTGEQMWEVNGSLPAHKLGELVGEQFDATEAVCTVSGLMTQRLGRFPRLGDAMPFGAWELCVVDLAGTRVARMQLTYGGLRTQDSGLRAAAGMEEKAREFVEKGAEIYTKA